MFYLTVLYKESINCIIRIVEFSVAAIGLIIAILIETMFSMFFQNRFFSKKDALNCDNNNFLVLFNFFRIIVGIFVSLRISYYGYFWVYLLFHFLSSLSLTLSLLFGNGLLVF